MAHYTIEKFAERCGVTVEFVNEISKYGGLYPAMTFAKGAEKPVEMYNSYDVLYLLWVRRLITRYTPYRAAKIADDIVDEYFAGVEDIQDLEQIIDVDAIGEDKDDDKPICFRFDGTGFRIPPCDNCPQQDICDAAARRMGESA